MKGRELELELVPDHQEEVEGPDHPMTKITCLVVLQE